MKKHKVILYILIIITTLFIWINSAIPAKESYSVSNAFKAHVIDLLSYVFSRDWLEENIQIRRLAHIFEFFILSTEFFFLARTNKTKFIHTLKENFSACLAIALCDETIQAFSYGRSSKIPDIWVDILGFAIGTAFCYLLLLIIFVTKKPKGEI